MLKEFGPVKIKFFRDYWLDDMVHDLYKIHNSDMSRTKKREEKINYLKTVFKKYPGIKEAISIMMNPANVDCDLSDKYYDSSNSTHGSFKMLLNDWKELKETDCKNIKLFLGSLTIVEFNFAKRYFSGEKLVIPHVTDLMLQEALGLKKKKGN